MREGSHIASYSQSKIGLGRAGDVATVYRS